MSEKKCPFFHNRSDYTGNCLDEKCMFFTGRFGCLWVEWLKTQIARNVNHK